MPLKLRTNRVTPPVSPVGVAVRCDLRQALCASCYILLLIAEFCTNEQRHIVSVFKLRLYLLAPSGNPNRTTFQLLMDRLPSDHKARWFAGAALNSSTQGMMSVLSTTMSKLNAFIDSDIEQLLCFDTKVDAESFISRKSAVFIVLPEETPTTFFLVSLIIQQLYRELLSVADEHGGKLPRRALFLLDEFGSLPNDRLGGGHVQRRTLTQN
jgi:type IV secretion system protein VirD4